jgi:protein-disulfide isomerase
VRPTPIKGFAVPDAPSSKNQRRAEAREAARVAREKKEKRERMRRWLIPAAVSVVIVAIIAVVVVVIVNSGPQPQDGAGPRNMISDGILFEQGADGMVPVSTPAIPDGGEPIPTSPREGVVSIVEYVDFACPICKQFEEEYRDYLEGLVSSGSATLEVHPVAILDPRFTGPEFSTRVNNAGACVADAQPESFLEVMAALFENQPEERSAGLTDSELTDIVHSAGVSDAGVDNCISDVGFRGWLKAATDRAVGDPDLTGPNGFGTPTLVVDGERWDANELSFEEFVESKLAGS